MCFFTSVEYGYLEKYENVSGLKCGNFRMYFFQKLHQLSQGINMLNAVVSNILGFLWRDTCVSSTQLYRPIWSKLSTSSPLKTQVAGSIPFIN
jgi:hypothetical protein